MKQALCKDARMQDCKVFNSEQTDTLVRPKSGFTPTKPEVYSDQTRGLLRPTPRFSPTKQKRPKNGRFMLVFARVRSHFAHLTATFLPVWMRRPLVVLLALRPLRS